MKKLIATVLVLLFMFSLSFGQDATNDPVVSFKGFVKYDAFFNSRQVTSAREGHFYLYPTAEVLDANGDDLNGAPNFNMLAIQTRLTTMIKGPDAFGAKTAGAIEGAFFGNSNADVGQFRLRHAWVKLSWEKSSLLFGQFWHPMFVTACFPGVVNFNTGVPFQPFSRNPQIRFTYKTGNTEIIAVAATQRDFTSPQGSVTLTNAVVPNLHLQLQQTVGGHLVGAGVDFKMLRPFLASSPDGTTIYKAEEKVTGISFIGFGKFKFDKTTVKVEGVLGQNLHDHLSISGYAIKEINATTGEASFTPMKQLSLWADISHGKKFAPGLFVGYVKNQGTADDNIGTYYSRGSTIDNVMRISPRLVWNSGKTRFAVEGDYTTVAFGLPDISGEIKNTESYNNIRVLFAAYYFFNK